CFFGAYTNCTIVGNSASLQCGGTYHNNNDLNSHMFNCIVYYNHAPLTDNAFGYSMSVASNCCMIPLLTNLVGCIDAEPKLASFSQLSAGSPCRGAGSPLFASGTDIDGESWNNPPSIGCDEFHVGASPLTVSLSAAYTNIAAGFT